MNAGLLIFMNLKKMKLLFYEIENFIGLLNPQIMKLPYFLPYLFLK